MCSAFHIERRAVPPPNILKVTAFEKEDEAVGWFLSRHGGKTDARSTRLGRWLLRVLWTNQHLILVVATYRKTRHAVTCGWSETGSDKHPLLLQFFHVVPEATGPYSLVTDDLEERMSKIKVSCWPIYTFFNAVLIRLWRGGGRGGVIVKKMCT